MQALYTTFNLINKKQIKKTHEPQMKTNNPNEYCKITQFS